MGLRLYNTLSRSVVDFGPLQGKKVRLYSCGPTVYDYPHIGNFRAFVFVDLLKRYLLFLGYEVVHITNITDVDDRIIKRCSEEGLSLDALTGKFTEAFNNDSSSLGILPAFHFPAATDHIREIQELIFLLLERGHAYSTDDGSVFFKISSFPEYGKLSRIDMSGLSSTQRVMSDNYDKEHIRDFALWKGWKQEDGDIAWESPWGRGRPGWHVECSAMSMKYLGEEFDIHCGGVDLVFPHHENEIAQSICGTGKKFARFWLHCEHLLVDGAKMSKSLGNYYTLRDLVREGVSPVAIRYLLSTTHYRQQINLTFENLASAARSVERLQDFRRRLESIATGGGGKGGGSHREVLSRFRDAMNDDLNISEAMAVVFRWVRDINRRLDEDKISSSEGRQMLTVIQKVDSVIGVISVGEVLLSEEDRGLIEERERARRKKDFERADEIRQYFISKGIRLEDTSEGTAVKELGYSEKE